jgi:hypothetical protein
MGVTLRWSAGILLFALLSGCGTTSADGSQRLIIAFQSTVANPADAGYLAALGTRVGCPLTHLETLKSGPHVYRCDAPAEALGEILSRLRQDPEIEFAEVDRLTPPAAP